ncbi:MAG TPA: (d)CMP kinase [Caulobacteraceae bacterium]|nr:(d)CMP kinase [Caulobacteraceae bacterium]
MDFVVAIDGPAGAGKGEIARRLGEALGLPVLDTGLLYRAVGVGVLAVGGDLDDADAAARVAGSISPESLDDPALRGAAAGEAASRVAVHAEVRAALFAFQRAFADRRGGAVIDGRDIGTVIAPDASVKLFVTASASERALRRQRQLALQGEGREMGAVLEEVRQRDARDAGRRAAPMRPAADAILLDTTDLDIDAAFDAAHRIVEAARARWEQSQSHLP